ncbi:initiation-control protein YabA [Carboxydothermus pertinax]|uniref:DNA replication initiation control protein YabA n=1 Tax=Carboxydothermus pertinax TaxID=870242 RepID=A0A1L8CVJ3_9THEO|nr:initiation control protein YabA [Carboxydothermus pertinax]GAV22936.1 conserved hypothetical protein [Carboxydothermus pertinax]
MNNLTTLLNDFEEKVKKLLEEYLEIKAYVSQLEEENQKLRQEVIKFYKPLQEEAKKERKPGPGFKNLARLYQEGFHVCHAHFGEARGDEDCLWCITFIKGRNNERGESLDEEIRKTAP